jgi:uncharacterized membrane protein
MSRFFGPGMVIVFCLSQAFRDVYFAHVFQGIDFFLVILLAFAISAVIFGVVTAIRCPVEFVRMRSELPALVWMNVTTALAWISYFYALKHLQPSIVNTLHSGMGPLTVIMLALLGLNITKPAAVRFGEYVCYAGLALVPAAMWWIVLSGRSGLATNVDLFVGLAGLALLMLSGAAITISHLISKRLNDRGIGAEAISATRYILIIVIAAGAGLFNTQPSGIATTGELIFLALATTALIALPLYALQLGVAHTAPLTAHVIRALGPVFIFGLELLDGRVNYSAYTLLAIIAYSIFVIASNLVHGWKSEPTAAPITPYAGSAVVSR